MLWCNTQEEIVLTYEETLHCSGHSWSWGWIASSFLLLWTRQSIYRSSNDIPKSSHIMTLGDIGPRGLKGIKGEGYRGPPGPPGEPGKWKVLLISRNMLIHDFFPVWVASAKLQSAHNWVLLVALHYHFQLTHFSDGSICGVKETWRHVTDSAVFVSRCISSL